MATVRQRLSGERRPRFWVDAAKVAGMLLALVAISWPFQSRGRARAFAYDAQLDLVDIDASKEEYWVGEDIRLAREEKERLKPGDPAPDSVAALRREGFLNARPRLDESGEFAINPLGKDPAFLPTRPVEESGIPVALPVPFSEVSTTIEIEDPAPVAAAAEEPVLDAGVGAATDDAPTTTTMTSDPDDSE